MLHVPEDPVRLPLETGWRDVGFGIALAIVVTLLFGLAPALRASGIHPMNALKGGDNPHGRRRSMKALLAAQMAFCVMVQFVAGLFVTTFDRLSHRSLGFSYARVAVLDVLDPARARPLQDWMEVADTIRQTPGVEAVSFAGWPLLSQNRWTATVLTAGRAPQVRPPNLLDVSPGFFDTMGITRLAGRDFRPGDPQARLNQNQPVAGVGIVNEAFARVYFDGRNPVGRTVEVRQGKDVSAPMEIIGYVRDAAYATVREPMTPTIYVPMMQRRNNTLLVRTAGDPLALVPTLRAAISKTPTRVKTIQSQSQFVTWQLLRERLLATLSLFFAIVALILAGFGLFGVLNYSVTQQRREIGIRMALGAGSAHVVRRITLSTGAVVAAGCVAGLAGGVIGARLVESLLFEVKITDADMVAAPVIALLIAAVAATLAPAIRAVQIDPARTLRSE
jgi:predicted permease